MGSLQPPDGLEKTHGSVAIQFVAVELAARFQNVDNRLVSGRQDAGAHAPAGKTTLLDRPDRDFPNVLMVQVKRDTLEYAIDVNAPSLKDLNEPVVAYQQGAGHVQFFIFIDGNPKYVFYQFGLGDVVTPDNPLTHIHHLVQIVSGGYFPDDLHFVPLRVLRRIAEQHGFV